MRDVEEIYQEMLAEFARLAGFAPEPGCDLAVRLRAAAAQIQALSIQTDWVLDQSFPQTAQGVYLDHHAAMRGITRIPAQKAAGILRFTVAEAAAQDLTVAAGTVCLTAAGTRFATTEAVTLTAGALWADATAEAMEAGTAGNAVPGSVTILAACPVGITGCTNPAAFKGGSDAETDEALRERILASYRRLPNGANAAWYEQTAMSHSGVAAAQAVGRARGIGTVDVYIAARGGMPEEALLEEVRADLQQRREIAVDVAVLAPETVPVNVTAAIASADFPSAKAAAETALRAFFTGERLGKNVLAAELGRVIFDAPGVTNYRLTAPTEDLAARAGKLPVLGTLTITELAEFYFRYLTWAEWEPRNLSWAQVEVAGHTWDSLERWV